MALIVGNPRAAFDAIVGIGEEQYPGKSNDKRDIGRSEVRIEGTPY
jgi:hypothetical protein